MSELVFCLPDCWSLRPSLPRRRQAKNQTISPLGISPRRPKFPPHPCVLLSGRRRLRTSKFRRKKDLSTKNGLCRQSILLLFFRRMCPTLVCEPRADPERASSATRLWHFWNARAALDPSFPNSRFRSRPFPLFERSFFPFFESRLCAKSHGAWLACAFYSCQENCSSLRKTREFPDRERKGIRCGGIYEGNKSNNYLLYRFLSGLPSSHRSYKFLPFPLILFFGVAHLT